VSITIITPHYNDLAGLLKIYRCLQDQTNKSWEWVIVDDMSVATILQDVKDWYHVLNDERVKVIFNTIKTNASVCRNLGVEIATHQNLVFLDADDIIKPDFVQNRLISFSDFAVFPNHGVLNENDEIVLKTYNSTNFINRFLSANFLWQTSCVLWNRSFFNSIGKFHPELPRLQDVELVIRALQKSSNYLIVDNTIDFYYLVKPIRERQNFVKPVCDAVYLFISELLDTRGLSKKQLGLLSGYYFVCARYLERSGSLDNIDLVKRNLKLFYQKGYIKFLDYSIGLIVLKLYVWQIFSSEQFLRINRYIFKPKRISG
jgi:glycosyltransferase involved in cell wall biosynthesis